MMIEALFNFFLRSFAALASELPPKSEIKFYTSPDNTFGKANHYQRSMTLYRLYLEDCGCIWLSGECISTFLEAFPLASRPPNKLMQTNIHDLNPFDPDPELSESSLELAFQDGFQWRV